MLIAMLLMSGLAAAFVIWPLFMRAAKAAGNEHDAAVMGLYRQRLLGSWMLNGSAMLTTRACACRCVMNSVWFC